MTSTSTNVQPIFPNPHLHNRHDWSPRNSERAAKQKIESAELPPPARERSRRDAWQTGLDLRLRNMISAANSGSTRPGIRVTICLFSVGLALSKTVEGRVINDVLKLADPSKDRHRQLQLRDVDERISARLEDLDATKAHELVMAIDHIWRTYGMSNRFLRKLEAARKEYSFHAANTPTVPVRLLALITKLNNSLE